MTDPLARLVEAVEAANDHGVTRERTYITISIDRWDAIVAAAHPARPATAGDAAASLEPCDCERCRVTPTDADVEAVAKGIANYDMMSTDDRWHAMARAALAAMRRR